MAASDLTPYNREVTAALHLKHRNKTVASVGGFPREQEWDQLVKITA